MGKFIHDNLDNLDVTELHKRRSIYQILWTFLGCLLCLFNIAFLIAGCALIGVGTYVYNYWKEYTDFLGGASLVNVAIALITLGCAFSITGFLGCCGVCEKSGCVMYTFSVFIAILVLPLISSCLIFGDMVYEKRVEIVKKGRNC